MRSGAGAPRTHPEGRSIRRRTLAALAAAAALTPLVSEAPARSPGCSPSCAHRYRLKLEARELRAYHRAPMPRCTWWGESGVGVPEWSIRRYRALNPSSAAGGEFQVLPSTWRAFGGAGAPHLARPVLQERIARRVLRGQGLGAWVVLTACRWMR